MKKLHELRIGNYSVYILADNENQASANLKGIVGEMECGCDMHLTGFVLEEAIEANETAVGEVLKKTRGLH